jgi:mannose-6-phosphate isomerase-like protein (cupin superfamily)
MYFSAAQIAATFGVGNLVDAPDHRIATARRNGPGESELHRNERDVFYILAGEATFVMGGEMEQPREVKPGDWRGTGIAGGDVFELRAGDVITIPPGVPHWFREVPRQIDYFVVKVIG